MARMPIPESVLKKAAEYTNKRLEALSTDERLARRALANPLPGILAETFSPNPDIQVGPYRIRPFYDIDFEFLKDWNHPVYEQMVDVMEGKESPKEFIPRGPQAWKLFWLMTTNPETVDEFCGQQARIEQESRKQFGKCTFAQLVKLYEAVVTQIARYSQTVIQYGNAGEEAKASDPFPTPRPTDSAG